MKDKVCKQLYNKSHANNITNGSTTSTIHARIITKIISSAPTTSSSSSSSSASSLSQIKTNNNPLIIVLYTLCVIVLICALICLYRSLHPQSPGSGNWFNNCCCHCLGNSGNSGRRSPSFSRSASSLFNASKPIHDNHSNNNNNNNNNQPLHFGAPCATSKSMIRAIGARRGSSNRLLIKSLIRRRSSMKRKMGVLSVKSGTSSRRIKTGKTVNFSHRFKSVKKVFAKNGRAGGKSRRGNSRTSPSPALQPEQQQGLKRSASKRNKISANFAAGDAGSIKHFRFGNGKSVRSKRYRAKQSMKHQQHQQQQQCSGGSSAACTKTQIYNDGVLYYRMLLKSMRPVKSVSQYLSSKNTNNINNYNNLR